MKLARLLALALALALAPLACDKTDAPAPSTSASALPPAPTASSPPVASASAASTASAPPTPTKDTVVSVFDPEKEPARTVNALAGGTVALYLPEWAGTSWRASSNVLGKAKEETIPGFKGPTPAHAFTWKLKEGLKGQTLVVPFANTSKGGGGGKTFTLTISVG
jgi:hypothetical protein